MHDAFSIGGTVFFGILLSALPFLAVGALASGVVEVYTGSWQPRAPRGFWRPVLAGVLLGMAVPVCECGVIPLARRLVRKGWPVAAGVGFVLAAPAVNLIAVLSTGAAFGWGRMLLLRVLVTVIVAVAAAAWALRAEPDPLRESTGGGANLPEPVRRGVWDALAAAGDDFLDMARYLVLGAAVAAALQTAVPRAAVLAVAQGPVTSVLALEVLAFVLSLCSSVDAFVARALAGTFGTGALVSFLVLGPMLDIKSTLMLLGVFKPRAVAVMAAGVAVLATLAGVLIHAVIR